MKSGKFWLAVLVAGVIANALDFIVQGQVLSGMYYAKLAEVFRQDTNIAWFVLGDFVAVLVLAWVYDKVAAAFGGGMKGGACCGFYLGVLASFPTYHFIHLMFNGYPYALTWISTIYGILWYVIAGAILAAVMKKAPAAAA